MSIKIKDVEIGRSKPLALIAGPCVLESIEEARLIARELVDICQRVGIPYIFKASYEKDNRRSISSYSGVGLQAGLAILKSIGDEFNIPVTSDVHRVTDIPAAQAVLDLIQIPAFLCRQTSLLVCASKTGKPINIKKAQFSSPEEMQGAVEKTRSTGNDQVLLTERGTCFGYNHLISDIRCISRMHELGCPVVYDPTHIVHHVGGLAADAEVLALSGVAGGADALFLETHPAPGRALCDGASMMPLDQVEKLLRKCVKIRGIILEQ